MVLAPSWTATGTSGSGKGQSPLFTIFCDWVDVLFCKRIYIIQKHYFWEKKHEMKMKPWKILVLCLGLLQLKISTRGFCFDPCMSNQGFHFPMTRLKRFREIKVTWLFISYCFSFFRCTKNFMFLYCYIMFGVCILSQ